MGARVLVVSYSLSGQTRKLARAAAAGLRAGGTEVAVEELQPSLPIAFPLGSVTRTLVWMIRTLGRRRVPVAPPSPAVAEPWDLVILAGPTWSYNPSGPLLSFLDAYGPAVLAGRPVVALISCRGYWRAHWWVLRRRIEASGGMPLTVWPFGHTVREPWRSAGVFLTIAGRNPRRFSLLARHYPHYGHDHGQVEGAAARGLDLARRLREGALPGSRSAL